ncbi:MAG: terminase family protein, partial [Pseudomonadota bacterium]
ALPPHIRKILLETTSDETAAKLLYDWEFWARPAQLPPGGDWFCWLVLAGRGFGKTRMGSEWIRRWVRDGHPLTANMPPPKLALIGATWADVRDVMVEGPSGILAVSPPASRPEWVSSRGRLVWENGSTAQAFSAEEPDSLRGPQHDAAWGDELAKWSRAGSTWANLAMGMRRGIRPQVLMTTTPRPIPALKQLMAAPGTVVTRGSTRDNAANLPDVFLDQMEALYGNTRLGAQELDGVLVETVEGALFEPAWLDRHRVSEMPSLERIVVAVDPPVTSGPDADACGIIVAGLGTGGHAFVLADETRTQVTPAQWATVAVEAFHQWSADRVVAEVNNGGDLVETLLRQLDSMISFRAVRASRGKWARAEPVAALYERGRVHHVGHFRSLELQMTSYKPGEPLADGSRSPDRLDALVWAIHELLLSGTATPRVRPLG